jgi:hypothetical protein
VETPRKFITAKLSIRKPGSSSVLIICLDFMEDYILENSSGICSDEKNKKWTKHPMAYR